MSGIKREMERIEELREIGLSILIEAGAIKPCPWHEDEYIRRDDENAKNRAYAMGTNRVKQGQIDGTREELMEAIHTAYETRAADECGRCRKMMEE